MQFGVKKNYESMGWWKPHEPTLTGFDTLPACDGRTDGQTDTALVAYYAATQKN